MMDTQYYFDKVKQFRDAVGLKQDSMQLHRDLYCEEVDELAAAVSQDEVADAIADMIFIFCGCMLDTGKPPVNHCESDKISAEVFWEAVKEESEISAFDLKAAFDLVYDSNMSKLVKPSEVDPTVSKYLDIGVELEIKMVSDDLFAVYVAEDCIGKDGKRYPKGKLMKSCNYHEPKWESEGWKV